jgi:hypothetical protein
MDDDRPDESGEGGDPDSLASLPDDIEETPTMSCSRCDRSWDLDYELDELKVGNRALERFALDHRRHTGHFPDDVTPWLADCRTCPDGERFLSEQPARRWAETHARHTRHDVALEPPLEESIEVVEGKD